jgi:DnaJ-domain-containing protein 1
MAQSDIEDHIIRSTLGDRPTWRYDNYAGYEEELYNKAWGTYHYTDRPPGEDSSKYSLFGDFTHPEREAMAIMGLEPPISMDIIKKRYKELAKKHHPDLNGKDPVSEELLKRINMSYTILKLAYEKYEKLDP